MMDMSAMLPLPAPVGAQPPNHAQLLSTYALPHWPSSAAWPHICTICSAAYTWPYIAYAPSRLMISSRMCLLLVSPLEPGVLAIIQLWEESAYEGDGSEGWVLLRLRDPSCSNSTLSPST